MDRREFLKSLAIAGVATVVETDGAMSMLTQSMPSAPARAGYPDLVAVMGGEPDVMFRKAIAQIGGMRRFVKRGYKVCVKPNIGWDKKPEMGSNTNPKLVAEIVRECFAAGASQVNVFDHTCDDWVKCYANSGIKAAVEKAGGKMVPANLQSYYVKVEFPHGKHLKEALVHKTLMESNVWINVPVLKNHEGAQLTICMKNMMGIVWDRGFFHRNDLQQCIADVSTIGHRACLNVVDAYRVMTYNGPRGRSASDVVTPKGLFVSTDAVAADTAAAKFFAQFRKDITLSKAAHIEKAEELHVGTTHLERLKVKKLKV
jgi:uncharacterized protein (DUF362 family)